MRNSVCGRSVCIGICPRSKYCLAGQERFRMLAAQYAVTLAQRRLARLEIRQVPLKKAV
jgi:hypothetical protein